MVRNFFNFFWEIIIKNSKTCYQYIIKQRQLLKAKNIKPILTDNKILISKVSFAIAKKFILQYEWLKNIGAAKYCFGLFIDGNLAAVVCYTDPVSPKAYKSMLGLSTEKNILQLCRGASAYWAPKWAPSKLISHTLKILSNQKEVIAVIAYADPSAGEVGIIYQACNALYIGMTDSGGAKYYMINGTKYHPRKVHKLYGTRRKEHLILIDPKYRTKKIKAKHRYLFLTGTKSEKKLILEVLKEKIQEYPKRKIKEI